MVALENFDARAHSGELVPEPVDAIVVDVSLISATKVPGRVLALASGGA